MGNALAAGKMPPLRPGEFRFTTKALNVDPAGDEGPRRFRTIASSTIKDLGKDEMEMSALEDMRDAFRRGVTMFLNHSYRVPEDVFGMSDQADIVRTNEVDEKGSTIWELHIGGFVDGSNPRAMQAADSIANGVKLGTSVGAIVTKHAKNSEGGKRIAHVDLKEGSIVGIPMNQRSWVQKAATAAQALDEAGIEPVLDDDDTPEVKAEEPVVQNGVPEGTSWTTTATTDATNTIITVDPAQPVETKGAEPADEAPAAEPVEITKDTTPDAPGADPAATPEDAEAEVESTDPAPEQKALAFDPGDVVELVRKAASLAEMVTKQATEIRDLQVERDRLAAENELAKQTIEKMLTLPLRPKAVEHAQTLSRRLPDFIDPAVRKMLEDIPQE